MRARPKGKISLWPVLAITYLVSVAGNFAIAKLGAGWPLMVIMDAVIGVVFGVVMNR